MTGIWKMLGLLLQKDGNRPFNSTIKLFSTNGDWLKHLLQFRELLKLLIYTGVTKKMFDKNV